MKRTGDKRGHAPVEWIWSDLFYWSSYEMAHERCMYWYKRQPNPTIYTGRRNVFKIQNVYCTQGRLNFGLAAFLYFSVVLYLGVAFFIILVIIVIDMSL